MMNLFLDANVLLDLLMRREPHVEEAVRLFKKAESGHVSLFASTLTYTNIYYIIRKKSGDKKLVKQQLNDLLSIVSLTPVSAAEIEGALKGYISDFEDGIQYQSAKRSGLEYIVTRDKKDFKSVEDLRVLSPNEALEIL